MTNAGYRDCSNCPPLHGHGHEVVNVTGRSWRSGHTLHLL